MIRRLLSTFFDVLRVAPLALVACLAALWLGCVASSRTVNAAPEAAALSRAALDTLEREACPRLLARTFPLEEPHSNVSTGRLWVRRCTAKRTARTLDLDVEVLGWQWSGEESWGFEVREYVYFSAAIRAGLSASIEAAGDGVSLRVWTERPPEVHVREIGRVDAKARTPASTLLGAASALVGQGPNVLATAALRSRVRDLIASRASSGIPIAVGEAPAVRGAPAVAHALLEEQERLHPGGALISGSFAPGLATTLRWSVEGDGSALARAVCVEEALELVDAVVAERKPPVARAPHDVITMTGRGEAVLPGLACRWVLVTGARDDRSVSVALVLGEHAERSVANARRQWVRATLAAYDLSGATPASSSTEARDDSLAVTFSMGPDDAPRSFGRALPASRAPSVGLVAPLFEIARGAPVVVRAFQQSPRAPSFFNATPGYDETALGRGAVTFEAGKRRQQHTVSFSRDGRSVGWARFDIELMDIE